MDTWWQTETGSILITPLPSVPLKPGSATRPFLGIEADVVDKEGKSLPSNAGGFAVIKKPWPSMMRTIYKDPDATRSTGIRFRTATPRAMSAEKMTTAICGSWAARTT